MGRPHRYLAAGAYYHVGIRGNNYAAIVLDDGDRIVFFHILRRIERRYGWRTHVRCLMGNHYHLLVETPLPNLSDGMRDLNGAYACAFNERHKREDHVFGRRYWSRVIESEDQYEAAVDYIVNNPLHHGFVRRLDQWRWTSGPAVSPIDSPRVSRHRQADPSAVARRLPDGRASAADRTRREVERRGLLRDVGRSLRPALLLRPRRAPCAGCPAPVAARRVHGGRALHPPVGELLPRRARAGGRRARCASDRAVPPGGAVRLFGAASTGAPEPRARAPGLRRTRFGDRCAGRGARPRLLTRDARAAREARGRDLEAAHDQVPVLLDLA
ncbi:MAG: hypothetical protein E6G18_03280 [Actinobacteria bacterium]|nr:MAG: hypothetical protein E6G18_03280 [Actinomycetota bacterium]